MLNFFIDVGLTLAGILPIIVGAVVMFFTAPLKNTKFPTLQYCRFEFESNVVRNHIPLIGPDLAII
jgi:hypothetical protein